ncbi:hypothetical protein Agub_g2711 [Astrephomene gubernaculifera]|uniref:N-alpha-acetyltransferase 40 n=1 Tax=Astrephomene gubernaculifera TaxID=47775 RepID=A0AAD3DIN3_9CHLO|nr:hypothetical protein Agub_g2711 [Astrephomene gubernaculifera]
MVSKAERIKELLRKAKQIKNPLAELVTAARHVDAKGQAVQVCSHHARNMPKDLQEWCLALCRENMSAMYKRVWSWSDADKRKQLASVASRFLIAHDDALTSSPSAVPSSTTTTTTAPAHRTAIGYVNYRFEQEEGQPVLYCYELQVVRQAQSRGVGRLLMELTEQIAWAAGMHKVMLTVFRDNTAAVRFYRRLGYQLDETSPDYSEEGESSPAAGDDGCGSAGVDNGGNGSGSGGSEEKEDAGCGYHIMSKRRPPLPQKKSQQQRHQAQVQQQQEQQHQCCLQEHLKQAQDEALPLDQQQCSQLHPPPQQQPQPQGSGREQQQQQDPSSVQPGTGPQDLMTVPAARDERQGGEEGHHVTLTPTGHILETQQPQEQRGTQQQEQRQQLSSHTSAAAAVVTASAAACGVKRRKEEEEREGQEGEEGQQQQPPSGAVRRRAAAMVAANATGVAA